MIEAVAGADTDLSTLAARAGDASSRPRHRPHPRATDRLRPVTRLLIAIACLVVLAGCEAGPSSPIPAISPGSSSAPREVNIIAKDWLFLPDRVDVVPGETVLLHVINGGLDLHEVVIGETPVQDAWEVAEAATVGSPPGPTPLVSVPPDVAGLRIVVASGQRVDVVWTVPAAPVPGLVVGCHIPGHWAKGMVVPVHFVQPSPHG
jgi:uncharacterized cupredoxin-like copper-binding protein